MKRRVIFLSFLFITVTTLFGACGSSEKKAPTNPVKTNNEQYQCPMKCTEEVFDKPGKCPVCEMELEKIANS